jgi:hypothetical protein
MKARQESAAGDEEPVAPKTRAQAAKDVVKAHVKAGRDGQVEPKENTDPPAV